MNIWVTRDEPADGPMSKAIREAGLNAVWEPVLTRRIVSDAAEEIGRLGFDDWLVLTSVYAVENVAADAAQIPGVAVVGGVSQRIAKGRGFRVELLSSDGGAKRLFEELRNKVTSGVICYPRSSLARPPISWRGVEIISPVLYETNTRAFDESVVDRVDVAAVASPSAVEAIARVDIPMASIGPTTTAAIRALGVEPCVEARERSFASLAKAIRAYASD